MMVIEPQEAGEQVRAGKLRVLVQLTESRLAGYPDIPTLKEAGYDVHTTPQIRGVVGPPQMAPEVARYWTGIFDKLRHTASWKKYLSDLQLEEDFAPGDEFRKAMVDVENELREQYRLAGIKTVR